MDKNETPHLDKILAEVENLREGAKILYELWCANGSYDRTWQIPDALHTKIQNYFDFDDSE